MRISHIETAEESQKALLRIEQLWGAEPNTPEGDELEALVTLVLAYEEKSCPIDAPDPIEALKFRIEQLSRKD